MEEEIWKPVKGYEGYYEVSDLGNVRGLNRIIKTKSGVIKNHKGIVLKQTMVKTGYFVTSLWKNGIGKVYKTHYLIAISFMGHTACGFDVVIDHINSVKTDNRLCNLRLVSNRENSSKKHIKSSSKYTGVIHRKKHNRYSAQIYINGKLIHLGWFKKELDAHNAYQKALKNHSKGNEIVVQRNKNLTSKYRGVHYHKRIKKWVAQKTINKKKHHIGYFETQELAFLAHHNFVKKLKEITQ